MKELFPIEAGRIVISRAGRDKGTAYIVLADPAEDRVPVADGFGRTADHPKLKNVKHLAAKPQRIKTGTDPITDEALRQALAAAGYDT